MPYWCVVFPDTVLCLPWINMLTVINIHGGAFMLGSSRMINRDQVQDCLDRNWVVLAPNHRLCPQVDLLEGPIADCRDLLTWVYRGDLQDLIQNGLQMPHKLDMDHVFAFGTSSGGTLALSLVGVVCPFPIKISGQPDGLANHDATRDFKFLVRWLVSLTCMDQADFPILSGRASFQPLQQNSPRISLKSL